MEIDASNCFGSFLYLTTYAQKGMNYDHVYEDLVKTREISKKTKAELERLTSALNQYGYAGSPQEIADMLEAQRREVDPEQVRAEREAAEAAELARMEAEAAKREMDRIRMEAVMAQDLLEIRSLDPNIKALSDLGETFVRLRAAGISNLEAYQLVSKPKATGKPDTSTGKEHLVKTSGGTSSGGLSEIPKSELYLWKEMFPNDSLTKLKERYNRSLKRQGK